MLKIRPDISKNIATQQEDKLYMNSEITITARHFEYRVRSQYKHDHVSFKSFRTPEKIAVIMDVNNNNAVSSMCFRLRLVQFTLIKLGHETCSTFALAHVEYFKNTKNYCTTSKN